ncbi:Protein MODIFYING WALL LIGNIN-1 [Linum perenne]
MDNQRIWLLAVVISLTLVSFASSIIAETKKLKVQPTNKPTFESDPPLSSHDCFLQKKDVKLQNELCDLPQSHAFGFGVAALVCLVITHTVSTLVICINFSSSSTDKNNKKPTIPAVLLLLLSWVSFGLAAVLLAGATSMNGRQPYGDGWVDGKCYVVKDGIYAVSGVLTLVSTASSTVATAVRKAAVNS